MKIKIFIFLFVLLGIQPFVYEINAKGTSAGTRITNYAYIQYLEFTTTNYITNTISTQVMAIYGMSEIDGDTNGFTPPGSIYSFPYSITNNGNTDITLIVTMSNFSSLSSNSVTNWQAYMSGFTTSQTLQGTNYGYYSFTNIIFECATTSFTLHIQTSPNSTLLHSGFLPLVCMVTADGTNMSYIGDNSINYGGTNINLLYPRVTILAPVISLKKALCISNQPTYLASGGLTGYPVPDTIITYTNYYDNDGNARATNLIIIDTIPTHCDLIPTSLVINAHTNSSGISSPVQVEYYYSGAWQGSPSGIIGPYDGDRYVRRIRLRFQQGVEQNNGDSGSTADGPPQDIDAGYFYYKVVVHRRRQ